METFFLYIIKASFCLVLLYIFFKALLSRETFFRFNRFVLLGGIIIASLLPLITLQTTEETAIQASIRHVESFFINNNHVNDEPTFSNLVVTSHNVEDNRDLPIMASPKKSGFPLTESQILLSIYMLGLSVSLAGLLISVFKMVQLIRKGNKTHNGKYIIVLVNKKICPFSFGKYIVLSEIDYKQNPTEILTHELVHARKKHSRDLIFMEFFVLLHWFNPVIWLLKRELQDIHEYEADNGVINQGIDATQYQLLLVKKAVGARSYTIANSFNHSKIKNRITMMLKRKSTQWARFKLILFVPVATVVLQAFARPEMTGIEETLLSSEVTTISQDIQKWSKEYFDKEVDEYVKIPRATNLSSTWKTCQVNLMPNQYVLKFTETYKNDPKKKCLIEMSEKTDDGLNKTIKKEILSYNKKNIKTGVLEPFIIFLNIQSEVSEERIKNFLDNIGVTNEEIKELWNKRPGGTEIIVRDPSPKNPVLVVINERCDLFSKKNLEGSPVLLRTAKLISDKTPPPPPTLKKTVKFVEKPLAPPVKETNKKTQEKILAPPVQETK